MAYANIINGRLACTKCDKTLVRIAPVDKVNEEWFCPEHGEVKKGVHHLRELAPTQEL